MKKKQLGIIGVVSLVVIVAVLFVWHPWSKNVQRVESNGDMHVAELTNTPTNQDGIEDNGAETTKEEPYDLESGVIYISQHPEVLEEIGVRSVSVTDLIDVAQTGGSVAERTGIKTDQNQLMDLVINTLAKIRKWEGVEEQRKEGDIRDIFGWVLPAVINARDAADGDETLMKSVFDVKGETIKYALEHTEITANDLATMNYETDAEAMDYLSNVWNETLDSAVSDAQKQWTLEDWCAVAGNSWFVYDMMTEIGMDVSPVFGMAIPDGNVGLMAMSFLHAVENTQIDDRNDMQNVILFGSDNEANMYGYSVNFELHFDANDQSYIAFIGNRNMKYVVLDIFDAKDQEMKDWSNLVAERYESTPDDGLMSEGTGSNAASSESIYPDETPTEEGWKRYQEEHGMTDKKEDPKPSGNENQNAQQPSQEVATPSQPETQPEINPKEDGGDPAIIENFSPYGGLTEEEYIERGEIERNRDKMLMLGGEWTSREKSPANVHAMHMLQEQMKGQTTAAGLTSEDDVAEWITQSRREENAELPAGRT